MSKMSSLKISFLTLFGYAVKLTLDINPIYGQIDRPCPNGSKNLGQSQAVRKTDKDYK